MKHGSTLLLCIATLAFRTTAEAQVACDILTPGALQGSYAHTWAEPATGSWNTPNMLDPTERVVGDLVLAYDGSASDSLCCAAIANAAAVNGKIAVLYRGTCDYSEKAKFCQNAGAIAVVIINNLPGAPAGMGAGSLGTQVTVPVFQIKQDDGAAWRAALDGGATLTALLGNKDGYFATDAGMRKADVLLPLSLAQPSQLAANADEYAVQVAATIHNYGSADQSGMQLRATIKQDGTTLYDQESAEFTLAAGDSAAVTLPDYTQPSWSGRYELTYTVVTSDDDEHALDNTIVIPFEFGDRFSLAPMDAATQIPVTTNGLQPATSNGTYESCVHFRDAHASRIGIIGVDRYVSISDPLLLDGELVLTRVYQWLDIFTGLSDPAFDISMLLPVHEQEHILETNGDNTQVYLPFTQGLQLDDNARYLVCTVALNPEMFFGYNDEISYDMNTEVYDQPTCPNSNGGDWFVGFVGGPVASIGVRTIDTQFIGIDEEEGNSTSTYPNPGNGVYQFVMRSAAPVDLIVRDATGRVVSMQRATGDRAVIDISNEAPGVYMLTAISNASRAVTKLVKE